MAADTAGGSSTINVPAGLYKLTIAATAANDPTNGDLDINNNANVTIVGAGSGSTTLDGNNLDRLFSVQQGASLTLSGMTLRRGYTNGTSTGSGYGGAIYTDGGLTIGNSSTGTSGDVVFSSNASQSRGEFGGAIYADTDSSVSLTGASFENNGADLYGGAIFDNSNQLLTINKSDFSGNQATDDDGGAIAGDGSAGMNVTDSTFTANVSPDGGAIAWTLAFDFARPQAVAGTAVSVSHSTFDGNSANSEGGAIADYLSGSLSLTYDRFVNNASASGGGALYLDSSQNPSYTVNHDLFSGNNSGDDYGGAIAWYAGSLESIGSTYVHNQTVYGDDGGALVADSGGSLTLVNDTISRNGVGDGDGGAIYVETSTPASLINDTIVGNNAYLGEGGGIYGASSLTTTGYTGSATPGIQNTVIADNTGGDCYDAFASTFDLGHNMDSDGSCFSGATDKPNTEPNLKAPADNGGPLVGNGTDGSAVVIPTQAETPASATVNAGTNTNCPATDQRGVTRPQGGTCDIGAFELGTATLKVKKSAPSSVRIHKEFTYTIKVTNSGTDNSNNTVLTDKIPSSETLKHVSASHGITCSHSGKTVTCKLGRLASGSSGTVKIVVAANKTGSIKNTATATNAEGAKASGHATTKVKAAVVKAKVKKKTKPSFTG